MKKNFLYALLLTTTLILSACSGRQDTVTPAGTMPTATGAEPAVPTPSLSPTNTSLPPSDGPFLLIQTENNAYEIMDFALDQRYPVSLPDVGQRIGLASALSSNRNLLKLPVQDGQVQLFDLLSGSTQTITIPAEVEFDAGQVAVLAQAALPDMALTDDAALSAVEASYQESIAQVWWGLDDNHLLAVIPGSPTSTQLASIEIASGAAEPLESLPGLIEKVSISGDLALLKKGYITEPGYWQDDQYTLLNLRTGEQQAIDLPEDAVNPILAWFDPATLSITHQSQPIGGVDFSLLNLDDLTSRLVIEGQFSSIRPYQQGLLVFRPDTETTDTIIERRDLSGDLIAENVLPEQYALNLIVQEKMILNCETESLLMDSDLETTPFSGPIFLLSGAPDGNTWIRVERSGQTTRLDSDLSNPQPIALEGAALEVRWLPDSTSFLYRTLGQLFLYDLAEEGSTLILESDLLGDYANINAVWIDISE